MIAEVSRSQSQKHASGAVPLTTKCTLLILAVLSACGGQNGTDPLLSDDSPSAKVDNGDGTYSLPIAPEDVPIDVLVDGAITYAYVGQAHLSYDGLGASAGPYTIGGQRPSELDELYDTVRVDNLGREWAVVHVDRDVACELAEQSAADCTIDEVPDSQPIEEGMWYPHSWSYPVCKFFVGSDVVTATETVYGAEDRNSVGSTFTARQRPTAALYYAPNAAFSTNDHDYSCSATVIRPNFVLTAAHCVTSGGAVVDPDDLQICTRGNKHVILSQSTCTHVLNIQVNNNWLTSGDKEWDFAILEVVADLESYVGAMSLSAALPEDIEAATLHQNGYPAADPGCNTSNISLAGSYDSTLNGVDMYHQTGSAFDATPDVVKTRMDGGLGHSGGSLYKCPEETCDAGEGAWLVGVWSGYFEDANGTFWTGGPSVPGHKTWILNHL